MFAWKFNSSRASRKVKTLLVSDEPLLNSSYIREVSQDRWTNGIAEQRSAQLCLPIQGKVGTSVQSTEPIRLSFCEPLALNEEDMRVSAKEQW